MTKLTFDLKHKIINEYLSSTYIKHLNNDFYPITEEDHICLAQETDLLKIYWEEYDPQYNYLLAKYGNIWGLLQLKKLNFESEIEENDICPYCGYEICIDSIGFENIKKEECRGSITAYAVEYGKIELFEWLKENGFYFDHCSGIKAVINNNLKILKWLYENNYLFSTNLLHLAIIYDSVDVLDFLKEIGQTANDLVYLNVKSITGLKWLLNNNYKYFQDLFLIYCKSKEFDFLKILFEYGIEITDDAYITIIDSENINRYNFEEVLDWLYEKHKPTKKTQEKMYLIAAKNNNVNLMKWLYNHNFAYDKTSILELVQKHVDINKYVYINKYIYYDDISVIINYNNLYKWLNEFL